MKRAMVMALVLAASMLFGTTLVARDASSGNVSVPPQSSSTNSSQTDLGTVTSIPLLVIVTNKGMVRDIQHSQRLPNQVNNLLWRSVQSWIKSSARVNGKRVGSQVYMDVALHSEPQADGNANVYFTLASIGPVMRGYWKIHGDRMSGPCSRTTGNVNAGIGGPSGLCAYGLTAAAAPTTTAMPFAH